MPEDNWITVACFSLLGAVLVSAIFYASGAYAQTVVAQCDSQGICFTTREVLELMLNYIQQLEMIAKGKCA